VEGLLTLLAVLFVCRVYGAETKLPVKVERKINLIRADFESNRTTLALRKATELSEQHRNDPQVHLRWVCCWRRKVNTSLLSWNWKGPTPCSQEPSKYRTVWDRPCY
jgi:hypothetical protein